MATNKAAEQKEDFGWNDKVDVPESSYQLLPEGPALFVITKLERQRKEFGKFGTINVAAMTFMCSPVDGDGKAKIQVQFGLTRALGWKIIQLASACSLREHGSGNEIDPSWWGEFEGCQGRCMIGHRKAKGRKEGEPERTFNEIAEFCDPESDSKPDNLRF